MNCYSNRLLSAASWKQLPRREPAERRPSGGGVSTADIQTTLHLGWSDPPPPGRLLLALLFMWLSFHLPIPPSLPPFLPLSPSLSLFLHNPSHKKPLTWWTKCHRPSFDDFSGRRWSFKDQKHEPSGGGSSCWLSASPSLSPVHNRNSQ